MQYLIYDMAVNECLTISSLMVTRREFLLRNGKIPWADHRINQVVLWKTGTTRKHRHTTRKLKVLRQIMRKGSLFNLIFARHTGGKRSRRETVNEEQGKR